MTELLRNAGVADTALRSALDGAQRLATGMSMTAFGQACRTSLKRVVVEDARASIEVTVAPFLEAVLGSAAGVALTPEDVDNPRAISATIDCAFQLKYWSNELRLVVPCASEPGSNQATPLVNAIARARHWYDQIVSGEIHSLAQLAAQIGTSAIYARRSLNLARLSPAVVESIVKGKIGTKWALAQIRSALPLDWAAQVSTIRP